MNSDDLNSVSGWSALFSHVYFKICKAIRNPTFSLSFTVVIIVCGSVGVWLPFLLKSTNVIFRPDALLTYGVSILASVIAEIILSEKGPKSLNMLLFSMGVVALILLICGFLLTKNNEIAKYSIFGTMLVLFVWLITNADKEKYDEKPSPNSLLGGTVTDSRGLSGEGL